MHARPLRNFIVVRQDATRDDVSPTGIVIAASKGIVESQRQLGRRGIVVAVGPDVTELAEGDRVLYGEFEHRRYREGGVEYQMLQDADIVGVIEDD